MGEVDIRVGVVGASGYAGQVLHALLVHHPCISPVVIEPREASAASARACADCRVVAIATPQEPAQAWTSCLREAGLRVLDLSGAHRLRDDVHYGLPELFGPPSPDSMLVSNPGCYPTAALLVLRPLLDEGLIEPDGVAVLGASGTSGAGKGMREDLHFSELHDNTFPYKVGEHRHTPEIEHHLGTQISFVTQLMPFVRGLHVTAFVRPTGEPHALRERLAAFYESDPYVTVVHRPGPALGVRHVVGSHQAVLGVGPRSRGGMVPVFATIDNLMRGAASQAVHNINLWLGLPAFEGLPAPIPTLPDGVPGMTRMLR